MRNNNLSRASTQNLNTSSTPACSICKHCRAVATALPLKAAGPATTTAPSPRQWAAYSTSVCAPCDDATSQAALFAPCMDHQLECCTLAQTQPGNINLQNTPPTTACSNKAHTSLLQKRLVPAGCSPRPERHAMPQTTLFSQRYTKCYDNQESPALPSEKLSGAGPGSIC